MLASHGATPVLSCGKPQNANVPPFGEDPRDVSEYRTCLHNSGSGRSSHALFAQRTAVSRVFQRN